MPTRRVTFKLPTDLARAVRRLARNRSRFVAQAIRRELDRRRRGSLRAALENPHPETARLAEVGFDEWAREASDCAGLVDPRGGTAVRWSPEKGWVKRARRRRGR
jgi:hypothetical protein